MNIALVSEHASPLAVLGGLDAGGQNVHVAALARALANAGNRVTVYTRRDARDLPRRVLLTAGVVIEHVDAGPPVPIAKMNYCRSWTAFRDALARAWRRTVPDIVHSHFWMSGKAALGAAHPLGIPVVQTFHALGSEKRRHQGAADTSPAQRIGEECAIARSAERIVATSSAEVFELIRMGADPRCLKVVPCGVDLEQFCPHGKTEERSQRLRIVTLSRLVERKGVADVIAALADVPGAELVVAGGDAEGAQADPQVRRLADLARELGVANRVSIRGRVERRDVPALLRAADVVACTPWYEPFGLVPLEAMACGVPVVVSAVGGLIDTVIDGVSGIHVPPRDPAQFARVLCALAADPERRRMLARAGMRRVHARYSWRRIAAETLEVYRVVVARAGANDAIGEDVS